MTSEHGHCKGTVPDACCQEYVPFCKWQHLKTNDREMQNTIKVSELYFYGFNEFSIKSLA